MSHSSSQVLSVIVRDSIWYEDSVWSAIALSLLLGAWAVRSSAFWWAQRKRKEWNYFECVQKCCARFCRIQDGTASIDDDPVTALGRAARDGNVAHVQTLIGQHKGNSILNSCVYMGNTALGYASEQGHWKIVEYLLRQEKIDLEQRNHAGETAFWLASYNARRGASNAIFHHSPHVHVLEILHHHGAHVDAMDHRGRTPLFMACIARRWKLIQRLLQWGALVNHQSVEVNAGESDEALFPPVPPVIVAASAKGDLALVKLLVEQHGADLELVSKSTGDTALLAACGGRHLETVRYLIERGANVCHTNHRGESALWMACRSGLECTPKIHIQDWEHNVENTHMLELEHFLWDRGCGMDHLNVANHESLTLLHLACGNATNARYAVQLVKWLLRNGANVQGISTTCGTYVEPHSSPLHLAVRAYHPGAMERLHLLLIHGANLLAMDNLGETPLWLATRHVEACFFLLRHHNMMGSLRACVPSTNRC